MSKQHNIPPKGTVPEDKLLAYLEGRLSPEEQREVEAMLADEGMESDALEGLKDFPVQDAQQMATRLNYKLQHDLKTKKYRNTNLFAENKWTWLAVFVVLLLCILAFYVIKL